MPDIPPLTEIPGLSELLSRLSLPGVTDGPFTLPPAFDLTATFLWAFTGALIGARRGNDFIGILMLALASATGGGLIRDGLFLQNGPPLVVRTPLYLILICVAALIVLWLGSVVQRAPHLDRMVATVDAFGTGAYAVVGLQLALEAGLSFPGALLVGTLNAVGGSVLRDVLTGREPEVLRPGTLVTVAAICAATTFLLLTRGVQLGESLSAWIAILVGFCVRMASMHFGIQTRPARGFGDAPRDTPG